MAKNLRIKDEDGKHSVLEKGEKLAKTLKLNKFKRLRIPKLGSF